MKKLLKELKKDLEYCSGTGRFTWLVDRGTRVKKGDKAGYLDPDGYERIRHYGELYLSHRLVWLFVTGRFPKDQVDHINRIKNDNRFCNLRSCSQSENSANTNKRRNNTSGYKGVCFHKKANKWMAKIRHNNKTKYIGIYLTKIEAAKAYNKKALELFGKFAYLNNMECTETWK